MTDANGKPLARPQPRQAALGPADLQSAYGLTAASGANGVGKTIAIVDAYDDPTASTDWANYRLHYGLTCSGCTFTKLDQSGGTSYPAVDGGWAQEESLDIEMASAICPKCNVVLVEANSSYLSDLGAAENTAASLHPAAISNSYGGGEYSTETTDEATYYDHPGIAITVSSGDSGYGAEFPAASQFVTAVGGTSLRGSIAAGWSETAWSGAGSGCSRYITKPAWQHDAGCAGRTIADVSADADPNTGVAVLDTTPYQNASGWLQFGGTSVASPIIAGVYAIATNTLPNYAASLAYPQDRTKLHDITSGTNGSCSRSYPYLCKAVTGYDGPTGNGTPNGVGAF